jgi:hypothetical protein
MVGKTAVEYRFRGLQLIFQGIRSKYGDSEPFDELRAQNDEQNY